MDDLASILTAATPGPWVSETVRTSCGTCHRIGPFPRPAYHMADRPAYACVYDDYPPGIGSKDLLANAALIAMAPDLATEVMRLSADLKAVIALNASIIAQGESSSAHIRELYARIAELEGE